MKNKTTIYSNLLLNDIKNTIRYSIGLNNKSEKNIILNGNLEEYFLYDNSTYFEDDFLEEVIKLIVEVIKKGRAFAIILKTSDELGVVKGLEIYKLDYIFRFSGLKRVYFIQKYSVINSKKIYHIKTYKKSEVIKISYKRLNINSIKIKRILRKLKKFNSLEKLLDLSKEKFLLPKELKKNKENEMVKVLKLTKKIGWNERESIYLTLPYKLYREVKFYKFLINIFNRTIDIINEEIKKQKDINVTGNIKVNTKDINKLNKLINQVLSGNCECDELKKYL